MNTNMIICTDICEYEYKYHNTQNKKKIYVYGYKSYTSMQSNAHMCHNIQFMVFFFFIKIEEILNLMIQFNIFLDKYEYNYIWVNKKRTNTNTNIFGLKKIPHTGDTESLDHADRSTYSN